MSPIVCIRNLTKTYKSGFAALKSVNLDIEEGEILALIDLGHGVVSGG